MTVEYLYDAIRATSGEEIMITAIITDENDEVVEAAALHLYDDETEIAYCVGQLNGIYWEFNIPADATKNMAGRYWYSICDTNNGSYCFKQPIYLL